MKNFNSIQTLPDVHMCTPSGRINGAVLAISSIQDALPIIHGSEGCAFHYRYLARKQESPASNLCCSDLKEAELIFGSEEKLRTVILDVYHEKHPPLIAIIPSVPVEIINSDIQDTIRSVQQMLPDCKLISVKSTGLSHSDKRYIGSNNREKKADITLGCVNHHDDTMNGCGFSDAMTSIVNEVMEKQTVIPKSINMCGIHGGIKNDSFSSGIIRELNEMGCTINARIPACSVEELKKAPSAELNLLSYRVRWARIMKEKFGTKFFAADYRTYTGKGITGLEQYYLNISNILNLPEAIRNKIRMKAVFSKNVLETHSASIEDRNCVIYCENYNRLDYLFFFFAETLKMNITGIWMPLSSSSWLSRLTEKERCAEAENKIQSLLAQTKMNIPYFINPDNNTIKRVLSDVRYIAGADFNSDLDLDYRMPLSNPVSLPMNFNDFTEYISDYVFEMNHVLNKNTSELLTNKLDRNRRFTPMQKNYEAAGKTWDKMWIQRGVV